MFHGLFVVISCRISSLMPLTGEILSEYDKYRCNYQVFMCPRNFKIWFAHSFQFSFSFCAWCNKAYMWKSVNERTFCYFVVVRLTWCLLLTEISLTGGIFTCCAIFFATESECERTVKVLPCLWLVFTPTLGVFFPSCFLFLNSCTHTCSTLAELLHIHDAGMD